MKCRLCNIEGDSQSIRADYVFGGESKHNFWQCAECNAIYLYPPLTKVEEKHFYKKEFEKYMSTRVGDHRDWSNAHKHIQTNQDQVRRRWKFLEPHIFDSMDILEIGCSSGFMLDKFKDSDCNVVGVEPSGEFLEFIKNNGHIAFETLEEVKASFDLICHFFVFEHIGDPFDFLEKQLSMLNKNGVIIAEIPSATDPLTALYDIDAFENFYWSIAHHYYYTPQSLKYILDKMNLKYELIPEQRYDLSNHITWMTDGVPGGQNRFNNVFSNELLEKYKQDLKDHWLCDTIFLKIYK
ncbi:class I SAM-dependent methyltransferase [Candidatus Woesearchaeota archaeon]|jgi:2-polyprenyl-3-methyl-5-hydroxy-6-metoxy-1,4-benzoquinol methylase|nr:class I SAM-dependent methyltransferase [Candidatus Woesearchaeota archaeon]